MADLSLKYTQPNTFAVATGQGTPFLSTTSMSSELGDIATEVPLVSNVDTGIVSVEQGVQPNQKQMAKMALYGSLNPLKVGILDGYAQRVAQDMDEKVIEAGAAMGKQTVDQVDKMVDDRVALANKLNQLGQQLAKTPVEIKAAQDRLKAIQEGRLKITEEEPSPKRYYSAVDKFVEMQQQAPQAPTLQKPQLAVEDQALIFLAGLAGGIQAVPQALQGAVAGAQQRAQLANEQAKYQYEQEQQNYNRQLQAQQTLLGKEATMLGDERARAARQYSEAQTRSIAEERMVNQRIESLKKDVKDKIKPLSDQFRFALNRADNIGAKDNEQIRKYQQVAVSYGLSLDEAQALFPEQPEGRTTLGKKIDLQQANNQARLDAMKAIADERAFAKVEQAAKDIRAEINYNKEITQDEADEANARVAKIAGRYGVDRQLLPVFIAGVSFEKQKADDSATLSRAREARVAAGGGRGGGGRAGGGKAKQEKRDPQLVDVEKKIREAEDEVAILEDEVAAAKNKNAKADAEEKLRSAKSKVRVLRKRQQQRINELNPTATGGEKVPAISKEEEARLRAEAERIRLEAEAKAKAKAKAIADAKAKAKAGGTPAPTAPTPAPKTPVKKGGQASSPTGRTGRFK
jgi:hypothetical protein